MYFWIGLGGALGAIARVCLMHILPAFVLALPLKMLIINVVGCFLIGVLSESIACCGHLSLHVRHFLVQGFLGGFTTFSAFALEFGVLYQKGLYLVALLYATLSVVVGLTFFFLGLKAVKLFS